MKQPTKPFALCIDNTDGNEPRTAERGNHYLQAVGRLKPGVTREQAQAELETIAAALRTQFPDTNTNFGASLLSLADDLVGDVRLALLLAVALVACYIPARRATTADPMIALRCD